MPIINGKFYINPTDGRGVERARVAETDRNDVAEQRDQALGGHWVTISGHHVRIAEDQAGRAASSIRDKIAAIANTYFGSADWGRDKQKDNFAPGTDKCNKFVYDVTKEAGAEATVLASNGKLRPPLAGEWADSRTPISGWRVLGPNETPEPGDVAAYKLPGHADYTGHSGIVTSVDAAGAVHGIAAHRDVVGPDEKFNAAPERAVTYRRYTGGH